MRQHPLHNQHRHGHLVPLRYLPQGASAVIVGYAPTHQTYRSKLLSMGLTKGTEITVKNIAPLGDPVHISVRDFELSLRADEADALLLEPTGDGLRPGRRGLRRSAGRSGGFNRNRRNRSDARWKRSEEAKDGSESG